MTELLYKHDYDEARNRLTDWWNGVDIGRPAMHILVPRETPLEKVHKMPPPENWLTDSSVKNLDYRINLSQRSCISTHFLAEAIPYVGTCIGTNALAQYLGCKAVDHPGSVWCEPCLDSPELAVFERTPDNSYWDFTLRLAKEQLRLGKNKFLVEFPDLVEGLDTLAAMRGNEVLLMDLIEHPDWVHSALEEITQRYFEHYDVLYDLIKDDRGGSYFWTWAPGRLSKLQCDCSAMISPEMFGEFMVPTLKAMAKRLDYCIYHWDGPGAIPHHDHLLSIPEIDTIQWTPGAGIEPVMHERWWDMYHKTIDAGKKVLIYCWDEFDVDELKKLKAEFGLKLNHFMIGGIQVESLGQAETVMNIVKG